MNYQKKKDQLIKLRNEILKEYQALYDKTIHYAETEMADESVVGRDIFGNKVTSLIVALLYVNNPDNKEVISKLREDIVQNKLGRKEENVKESKIRDEILKDYQELLIKSLRYGHYASELSNMKLVLSEIADFQRFISDEEDSMKITSLIASLLYVEHPNDSEVVATLRRDIAINKYGRK